MVASVAQLRTLLLLLTIGRISRATEVPWQVCGRKTGRFSIQRMQLFAFRKVQLLTSAVCDPQAYHKTSQILDLFRSASTASSNLARYVLQTAGLYQTCRLPTATTYRYQDIPDPTHDSELSLPLITITDFKTGETGKEVIFLVAGEHAR